jgi:hypothetical protein
MLAATVHGRGVLIKLGIATTGLALLLGGAAQAVVEPPVIVKPPNCQSAVQIGKTGFVRGGGTQLATIRQWEGCGGKYGHVRVHADTPFRASVRLSADDTLTPPTQGEPNQRDVWTFSKALNGQCSAAVATVQVGQLASTARSGLSC